MKKLLFFSLVFAGSLYAAVLSSFDCDNELANISFDGVNWGSYGAVIFNKPDKKADIDESIAWKVASIMTNETFSANTMATTATNKNITIPAETWDYINAHLPQ